MADTTQFTIGTKASCSNGAVGTLSRVIVDPVAQAVTHLVIDPERGRDRHGGLVPLDLVEGAAGGIRLRCTKAEFEDLDAAENTQLVPRATDPYGGYGPAQIGFMPYYGLGSRMIVPGGFTPRRRRKSSRRSSPLTPSPWARWKSAAATPSRPPTATSGAFRGLSSTPPTTT